MALGYTVGKVHTTVQNALLIYFPRGAHVCVPWVPLFARNMPPWALCHAEWMNTHMNITYACPNTIFIHYRKRNKANDLFLAFPAIT